MAGQETVSLPARSSDSECSRPPWHMQGQWWPTSERMGEQKHEVGSESLLADMTIVGMVALPEASTGRPGPICSHLELPVHQKSNMLPHPL